MSAQAIGQHEGGKVNPRLVERQAGRAAMEAPGVDVFVIAANAEEASARLKIRNLDGFFVSWVNKALREWKNERRLRAEQDSREQDRYSTFQVELFRLISEHQLGPRSIADLLERTQRSGFRKLNPKTIEKLRRIGDNWPPSSAG